MITIQAKVVIVQTTQSSWIIVRKSTLRKRNIFTACIAAPKGGTFVSYPLSSYFTMPDNQSTASAHRVQLVHTDYN